jgi:hypothetical protein
MKRKAISAALFGLVLTLAVADMSQARDLRTCYDYGSGGYSMECRRCPVYGRSAPCKRHVGPRYWYDYGWPGYSPDRSAFGSTLSKGEARKLVQWIIRCDPNLEVGDILKVDEGYEIAVVTRKGKRLVDTIFVEKDTAYVYPVYKPAEK